MTTSKAIEPTEPVANITVPEALARAAAERAARSLAAETRRAYKRAARDFAAFCRRHGQRDLPAEPATVALFLEERAQSGCSVSTLEQTLAAIKAAHELEDLTSPTASAVVRRVMRGIRRDLGVAPQNQKAAMSVSELSSMIEALPTTLRGRRDRALLLLGFAGAFRRSELVALKHKDLEWVSQGVVVTIRRSKTDPEGRGRKVAIPRGRRLCPPTELKRWLEVSGIDSGPLFRPVDRHDNVGAKALTGHSVARIVKLAAEAVGLDPERYAGHSLRAGLATSAARARKPLHSIMKTTGHRSTDMALRYVREAELFDDVAVDGLL